MAEPVSAKDMADVVRRRARIQNLLLELWTLGNEHLSALKHPESTLYHLSLGAAFSLWRAAFLIQDKRTRSGMNRHAMSFLTTLCWDNAIAYGAEKNAHAWMVGYYLNNAALRLQSAAKHLPAKLASAPCHSAVRSFVGDQHKRGVSVPNRRKGWDNSMEALESVFGHLRSTVARRKRSIRLPSRINAG